MGIIIVFIIVFCVKNKIKGGFRAEADGEGEEGRSFLDLIPSI